MQGWGHNDATGCPKKYPRFGWEETKALNEEWHFELGLIMDWLAKDRQKLRSFKMGW